MLKTIYYSILGVTSKFNGGLLKMAGKRCLRLSLVLFCLLILIGFGVYSLMIHGVSAAESLQKEGLLFWIECFVLTWQGTR